MRQLLVFLIAVSLLAAGCTQPSSSEQAQDYDVVIYGATSADVIAAVQSATMGKSVLVVGPNKHLGGLSAGGLGFTDSGKKEVIGGSVP